MHTGIKILLFISIVFSLIVAGGYVLPATFRVHRSITINSNHSTIYPYINNLQEWEHWTAWTTKKDSTLKFTYGAKTSGEGAVQKWRGDEIGDGILKVVESYPLEGITYEVYMNERQFKMDGRIRFFPQNDTITKVDWICKGNMESNPLFRYMGLMMDNILGNDLQESLEGLKNISEIKAKETDNDVVKE